MATSEKFKRIFSISKMNGWSIAIFAGLITLFSLLSGSVSGILIGILITSCGVLELMGRSKLVESDERSAFILPGSQLLLLITIWAYSAYQLLSISPESVKAAVSEDILLWLVTLTGSELVVFELVSQALPITYVTVIIITAIYQGGLAIYYWKGSRYLLEKNSDHLAG
ncbi:MAG: hypothetical protein HQ510_11880 [Candidatus Marinimicrobia bacterium]|nr:hypothetical protein [Candidatus Neomarinimicrobiota bacterium]